MTRGHSAQTPKEARVEFDCPLLAPRETVVWLDVVPSQGRRASHRESGQHHRAIGTTWWPLGPSPWKFSLPQPGRLRFRGPKQARSYCRSRTGEEPAY